MTKCNHIPPPGSSPPLAKSADTSSCSGYEVKCGDTESENAELRNQVQFLETTKLTLVEEARELKEAIENARDTLNSRVELESYKNPALAAVAALWMQEREVGTWLICRFLGLFELINLLFNESFV